MIKIQEFRDITACAAATLLSVMAIIVSIAAVSSMSIENQRQKHWEQTWKEWKPTTIKGLLEQDFKLRNDGK